LSLVRIATGFVVVFGLITAKQLDDWTAAFFLTTVATSLTGFLFPFHKLLPSHVIGIISLVTLAIALLARYLRHLTGAWRWIYVVNVVISLYLNVFVLVAQLLQKIPGLKALAPTQSEPPFLIAQVVVMALFIMVGIFAVRKFHVEQLGTTEVFAESRCNVDGRAFRPLATHGGYSNGLLACRRAHGDLVVYSETRRRSRSLR
jgi:hypothetical protein